MELVAQHFDRVPAQAAGEGAIALGISIIIGLATLVGGVKFTLKKPPR